MLTLFFLLAVVTAAFVVVSRGAFDGVDAPTVTARTAAEDVAPVEMVSVD